MKEGSEPLRSEGANVQAMEAEAGEGIRVAGRRTVILESIELRLQTHPKGMAGRRRTILTRP